MPDKASSCGGALYAECSSRSGSGGPLRRGRVAAQCRLSAPGPCMAMVLARLPNGRWRPYKDERFRLTTPAEGLRCTVIIKAVPMDGVCEVQILTRSNLPPRSCRRRGWPQREETHGGIFPRRLSNKRSGLGRRAEKGGATLLPCPEST